MRNLKGAKYFWIDAPPFSLINVAKGVGRRSKSTWRLLVRLLVAIALFLAAASAHALTCTAIAGANNWGTAATWTSAGNCNRIPAAADVVIIPSGATVTVNVNTASVVSVNVNFGGVLQGDGAAIVKTLTIDATAANDLVNDGILDFSGVPGVAGSKSAIVLNGNNQVMDIVDTADANFGVWRFSTIDFNNRAATMTGIRQIEFAGSATPVVGTFGATRPVSGAMTCTWLFSGATAQTITVIDIATLTTWTAGTANIQVTNTAGLTLPGATTISGDLDVSGGGILTLQGTPTGMTINGGDTTIGAASTLNLSGASTDMVTSTRKTFNATSTVNYAGSGAQTVSAEAYGNLTFSNAGNKSPATGTFSIAGNLSMSGTAAYAGNTSNPTVTLAGNIVYTGTGTFNVGTSASAFTFNGSAPQASSTLRTFAGTGTMIIANTDATSGVSLSNAGLTTLAGALTINSGSILTLLAGAANAFPTVTGTVTVTGSTVRYAGTTAQSVLNRTYHHLVVAPAANTITHTFLAGTFPINGDLTLGNGINTGAVVTAATNASILNVLGSVLISANTTLTANATQAFTVGGNWTRSGTFTPNTGRVTFNGTVAQTLNSATTFDNITINNSAVTPNNILTLNAVDITINTNLTFLAGKIVTGANKVAFSATGTTLTGGGTGWVVGNFEKVLLAGASPTFEVGSNGAAAPALAYTPVSYVFTGGAGGTLKVAAVQAEHANVATSGIDNSRNINRNWTMSGTVTYTSYAATVTFIAGDIDSGANTGSFVIKKWSGAAWTGATAGVRTGTTTQATAISGALPNDLAVGQAGCIANAGTGFWNTAGTWKCGHVPLAGETVNIPSGATVTVDVNTAAVDAVTILSGGVLQGDGNATPKILNVDGTNTKDVLNDGTLDFSGVAGAGGSKAAVVRTNTAALDYDQTAANPSTWKFSAIDFNSIAATLANITAIEMNGHATPFQNTVGAVSGAVACTWTFSGATAQAISGQLTTWSSGTSTFTMTNTNATGVTLSAALTLSGNLNVNAGAVLSIGGTTTTMPTVTGIKTFNATSTTFYSGTGAQAVSAETYGNLTLSGATVKTPASGTVTVTGNFILSASTTWTGTTNNPTVNFGGNFSNSGTAFSSGSGIYTFNGTAAQTFTGATTFRKLTIANTGTAPNKILTLSNDLTIGNTAGDVLTFTSGNIVTGANKVVLQSNATIAGAASGTGWVAGNLQKFVAAGASSPNFEVGTNGASAPSLAYTPINFAFTGVGVGGGSFIAYSTAAEHAQISSSGIVNTKSVNRNWTSTLTGVTGTALPAFTNFDATFNYNSSDLDGGASASNVHVERWSGTAWSVPTISTRTATSAKATGITALGEFAIGEPSPPTLTKTGSTFSDPVNNTTNQKAIPGAIKEFTTVISNPSAPIDSNTVFVSDVIDSNLSLKVSDLGGVGSGPVLFSQGATSSGMTYSFVSLSSGADNLEFSNDNGLTWTYSPTAGAGGCDVNVTTIRVKPQGVFSTGVNVSPAPSFQLTYRACIK